MLVAKEATADFGEPLRRRKDVASDAFAASCPNSGLSASQLLLLPLPPLLHPHFSAAGGRRRGQGSTWCDDGQFPAERPE